MFKKEIEEYKFCRKMGFDPVMSVASVCPWYIWIPSWAIIGYVASLIFT